jgi:hypothetical protein
MINLHRFSRSRFLIRLQSWEYWPFGIVQFPLFFYWFWLSLKARSLLFFSASNPSIVLGGMFGESKYSVLKQLPEDLIPISILIETPATVHEILMKMQESNLSFPVIFKPDIGERGFRVKRICHEQDIADYIREGQGHFIIQELIDWPVECGIFYTRFPKNIRGKVTSVVLKNMLAVTGNGKSTLLELIFQNPRAILQRERLCVIFRSRLDEVIAADEHVVLNSIGNHCLGTEFLNGNHLISDALSERFDSISKQMDRFYFGRFDLRCPTVDDLVNGELKILEVNGCGAEPAHIYQPGTPIFSAWKDLFLHWKNLYRISKENNQLGHPYTPVREGVKIYRAFVRQMKT